jgi:thioredoxin-related protein
MDAWHRIAGLARCLIAALAFATTIAAGRAQADELVMFQLKGCPYCRAWNSDVGRIYAKTDEAKRLPLRRIDILAPRPQELRSIAQVRYTPTFIVMHCGREFRRIEGYDNPDQFWGLLDSAIAAIDETHPAEPSACPK